LGSIIQISGKDQKPLPQAFIGKPSRTQFLLRPIRSRSDLPNLRRRGRSRTKNLPCPL
jgi:hypothetical protein